MRANQTHRDEEVVVWDQLDQRFKTLPYGIITDPMGFYRLELPSNAHQLGTINIYSNKNGADYSLDKGDKFFDTLTLDDYRFLFIPKFAVGTAQNVSKSSDSGCCVLQ